MMVIRPIQIGNLKLASNVLLAPMSGYCDLAFRLVARSCGGVGLACTDLLCPEGVLREGRKSMELASTCEEDSPLAMQLYGCEAEKMAEAGRWAEDHGAAVVDINMGCPADKITKRNGGSKLLCDPEGTLRIVERIAGTLRRAPLTAKLRLGWDDEHIVAPYMAKRLEEMGVAMITVHGRTTEMRFSGQVRLDGIAEVVGAVKRIPVVGNGDVRSPWDARVMIEKTGCSGVMLGRAALAAPWLPRDIWSSLSRDVVPEPPTIEQKCELMRRHFYNMVKFRHERAAVLEFRKRVSWYAKHLHPCRMLQEGMRFIKSAGEFEQAIERFLEWRTQKPEESASLCC